MEALIAAEDPIQIRGLARRVLFKFLLLVLVKQLTSFQNRDLAALNILHHPKPILPPRRT